MVDALRQIGGPNRWFFIGSLSVFYRLLTSFWVIFWKDTVAVRFLIFFLNSVSSKSTAFSRWKHFRLLKSLYFQKVSLLKSPFGLVLLRKRFKNGYGNYIVSTPYLEHIEKTEGINFYLPRTNVMIIRYLGDLFANKFSFETTC